MSYTISYNQIALFQRVPMIETIQAITGKSFYDYYLLIELVGDNNVYEQLTDIKGRTYERRSRDYYAMLARESDIPNWLELSSKLVDDGCLRLNDNPRAKGTAYKTRWLNRMNTPIQLADWTKWQSTLILSVNKNETLQFESEQYREIAKKLWSEACDNRYNQHIHDQTFNFGIHDEESFNLLAQLDCLRTNEKALRCYQINSSINESFNQTSITKNLKLPKLNTGIIARLKDIKAKPQATLF